MTDPVTGWLLPALMFSLMFGMGLALTPDDFRRIAKVPAPVVMGTLLQLIVMPMIGFGLALHYELSPLLAVGLVVCSACPGGMGSNIFVHLGRANTALSITLTATATSATLFTLPLWIRAIQTSVGGEGSVVEVPVFATAIELGGLTILPVALGMTLRQLQPAAARFERPLTAVAAIALFGKLFADSLARPDPPEHQFLASLPPALWLAAAGLGLGSFIPWLLRQPVIDVVTIGTELCIKNTLLGMVILTTSFGVLEPNIPLLVYSTVMAPPVIVVLVLFRVFSSRRA